MNFYNCKNTIIYFLDALSFSCEWWFAVSCFKKKENQFKPRQQESSIITRFANNNQVYHVPTDREGNQILKKWFNWYLSVSFKDRWRTCQQKSRKSMTLTVYTVDANQALCDHTRTTNRLFISHSQLSLKLVNIGYTTHPIHTMKGSR